MFKHDKEEAEVSWAKVDDHANEHPKLLEVGAEAAWLWVCGLMYANRQKRRDGAIPKNVLGMLYPFKNAKKLAAKLVLAGLWDEGESTYDIHDFHVWNHSTDKVEDRREATRIRVARHRARNGVTPSVTGPPCNGVTSVTVPDPLHSTPLPDPKAAEVNPRPPGRSPPAGPEGSAAAAAGLTRFEDSLKVPIAERAKFVERDPSQGEWLQAQRWPEVVEVAKAWGETRLGRYGADSGVRALVALFATGYSLSELLNAVPRIRGSDWARGKKLGMASMTPEVVRRALDESQKPDDGLTREERIELKFAEAKQRKRDEIRAARRQDAVSKS